MYADSCKWSKHFFAIFPIPQSAEDDTLKADVLFLKYLFLFFLVHSRFIDVCFAFIIFLI